MARLFPMVGFSAALVLSVLPACAAGQSVNNEQITAAIKQAVNWIYQQQSPWGTWEVAPAPRGIERDLPDQGQYGLQTALALHALLAAGESDQDERLQRAVDFLITSDRINGVYAVGMRAQVWPLMHPTPAVRQAMARDRNILLAAQHTRGKTRGLYSYLADFDHEPDYADHAVSFYGSLGVAALADAGIEVPDSFWTLVQRTWRTQQSRDGSWSYGLAPPTAATPNTIGMTAAGVALLFNCTDQLAATRSADCQPAPSDRAIENGVAWIDSHFSQSRDEEDFLGYKLFNHGLYAVARIGAVSGRKYFNQRDWYADGATMLLDSRDAATGAWSNFPDTCFAVLFLAQGRDPVLISKLQYRMAGRTSTTTRTTNWNLRPRDVANFNAWFSRENEREYNWQTVNLAVPVEELHDSAILYMTGNQTLNLSAADKAKLRTYILEGGLILGNADCGSKEFADSFRRLGAELFPAYEFRSVAADNVILTAEQYRGSRWKQTPQVLELSNGVRELMLLAPDEDFSRYFQRRQFGSRQYLYELMSNILNYSVDQTGARLKGETFIVRPDPTAHVRATVKVARLQYDGNWDPEPAGWDRLTAVMHNTRGIDLQAKPIRPGEGKLDRSFAMAHLTGTAAFHLSAPALAEMRDFVAGGGTLVIDAAGGNAAFDAAAQAQIKSLFPDGALELLATDQPVFSAGQRLTHAAYRRFARRRIGDTSEFRLLGMNVDGRRAVYYSAEDLSEGLVGQPIDGVVGYQPAVATALMANLVTLASHGR